MLAKINKYIKNDIWRVSFKNLPRRKSLLLKPLMIIVLAIRGFDEHKCQLRASALTFYSLLSVVPILAMAFGISKGFGLEKMLEQLLLEKLPGQADVVSQIIGFSHKLLENTKGGLIAGIGVALLFWTVIKVLSDIEEAFNDIWGIKQSRDMLRKFSDYLSIMLICPVLFIVASSVTVVISSQIKEIIQKIAFLGTMNDIVLIVLSMLPYAVIWILFTFLYIFMPNTKVNFSAGILGGIIAGTIYQLVQVIYISFQIGVAQYNAIYGSFAALPLFLVWLQMSWRIVLFGAELSFAAQNLEMYEFEPDCLKISYNFKKLVTLRIMHVLVKNFVKQGRPWTAEKISHELEVPIRLVEEILYELKGAGLISQTTQEEKSVAFQPARSTHDLTIKKVIDLMENRGENNIPVHNSKEWNKISDSLKAFGSILEKSPENILLEEI